MPQPYRNRQIALWEGMAFSDTFTASGPSFAQPATMGQAIANEAGRLTETLLKVAADGVGERQAMAGQSAGLAAGRQAAIDGAPLPVLSAGSNIYGRAHNEAARAAYLNTASMRQKLDVSRIATDAGDDLAKFDKAIAEYGGSLAKLDPGLGAALADELDLNAGKARGVIEGRLAERRREFEELKDREALDFTERDVLTAARNQDGEALRQGLAGYSTAVDTMVASGRMSAEEAAGKKAAVFEGAVKETHVGNFYRELKTGGFVAARAYGRQVKAGVRGLSPEQSDRLAARIDRELDGIRADADRAERLADKRVQKQGDEALKTILFQIDENQATVADVEAAADVLTPTQVSTAIDRIHERAKGRLDPNVYIELIDHAKAGDDVTGVANEALARGNIDRSGYDKALAFQQAYQDDAMRRGLDYIEGVVGGPRFGSDPLAAVREAQAKDALLTWRESQGVIPEQMVASKAREIAKRYELVETENSVLTAPKPLYLAGTRSNFDVAATARATKAALDAGRITDQEFRSEMALIAQWQRLGELREQKRQAQGAIE